MKGGTDWQVARSLEADFEKNTWTFEMREPYHVRAGEFAIVIYEAFHKQGVKLARAEGILRDLMKGNALNEKAKEMRERVESFFDPEPLV